ncbi:MAG: hypothetical protein ACX93J_15995, partial [Flagellimonas marinaquae]
QLEPVQGKPIYGADCGLHWENALTHLVELKGLHRFRHCKVMQELTTLMREGKDLKRIRAILDSRIIDQSRVRLAPSKTTRYATYDNKTRAKLNAITFRRYLEKNHPKVSEAGAIVPASAVIIKTFPMWEKTKKPLSRSDMATFFDNCSEQNINGKTTKTRIDSLLCLYDGCPIMCSENSDVRNGIANGTCGIFKKVILKKGKRAQVSSYHDRQVYAISINDVDHIVCGWEEGTRFRGTFKIFPKKATFNVKFPLRINDTTTVTVDTPLTIVHLPIVRNSATTGHKLQGKSVDELVVAQWVNLPNWPYVVVSRVRTIEGLLLLKPLPDNISFEAPVEYTNMMKRLRLTIAVQPITL